MKLRYLLLAACLSTATLALPAAAFEPGDIILRGGAGLIFPNDDSNSLTGLPGATVGVEDAVTFAFTAGYMLTNHFAIELLGIWPANHDIEGEGILPGLGVSDVGDLDVFPPTLSVNYYFQPQERLSPHIGFGVNSTWYWNTEASAQTKAVLGPGTDLNINHSVGWAVNIGLDYDINDRFFATAGLWYVDIDAEASLKTTALGQLDIDVDVDPLVAMFGFGVRF